MSDPRTPLEEDVDLGEIEEVEGNEAEDEGDAGDAPDAEVGGEDTEDQDAEVEARDVAERRPSRSQSRVSNLTRQLAEERTARERIEREIAELRTQRTQPAIDPAAQARAEAEEAERVRQMMPEEQIAYYRQKDRADTERRLFNIQVQMLDQGDRTAFESMKARNPSAERLSSQVEQTLGQLRAQGIYTIGRQDVFYRLLGEEVAKKASSQAPRQRREAARRVAAQTTRPGSARGDIASTRRTGQTQYDADRAALSSMTLDDL